MSPPRATSKGSVSLLITGDEEGPSINGTGKLLDWAAGKGESWDAAIVGEPTNPDHARRHDQDRPARLDLGHRHRARPAGPCRLSASRRQSGARAADADRRAAASGASTRAPQDFQPTNLEDHLDRCRQPGDQRHSGARRRPPSTSASTTPGPPRRCRPRSTTGSTAPPSARNTATGATSRSTIDLAWRDRPSEVFLTRDDKLIGDAERLGPGRHRPHAGAVDLGRHVGRALHQGLLPGGRVRARRQDHAHGRRARRACRSRDADRHL